MNPPPGRYAIEIHRANKPSELKGCIGVGLAFGNSLDVIESLAAMDVLVKALEGRENEQLHIVAYRPSVG